MLGATDSGTLPRRQHIPNAAVCAITSVHLWSICYTIHTWCHYILTSASASCMFLFCTRTRVTVAFLESCFVVWLIRGTKMSHEPEIWYFVAFPAPISSCVSDSSSTIDMYLQCAKWIDILLWYRSIFNMPLSFKECVHLNMYCMYASCIQPVYLIDVGVHKTLNRTISTPFSCLAL